MKKQGKILRDPRTGPGLLIIEGRQYWFSLEGIWQSELPPKPGLSVDVKLDQAGKIVAITASESQFADRQSERPPQTAKTLGVNILRKLAAKCGMRNLLQR
jgi:hypothetical protein